LTTPISAHFGWKFVLIHSPFSNLTTVIACWTP
jgi:hypothetical protein